MAAFLHHAGQAYPRENYNPFFRFRFYFSVYSNFCVPFSLHNFFLKSGCIFFLVFMSRTRAQSMSSFQFYSEFQEKPIR